MWMLLFFLPLLGNAQDVDVKAIRNLENVLPDHDVEKEATRDLEWEKENRNFENPHKTVHLEDIKLSRVRTGYILERKEIYRLSDNKKIFTTKPIYSKYYHLQDEQGFRYLVNKDGTTTFKIVSDDIVPVNEELKLYEPPLKYTPAPTNIVRAEYDSKLKMIPEVGFFTGIVNGSYMADLFRDSNSSSGITNHFVGNFYADWKLPVIVGAALHYERASFDTEGGGKAVYTSPSLGPQFRTRTFEVMSLPLRFEGQVRYSPFAQAKAELANGSETYKFNSTDLLASLAHPFKNSWGSFNVGLFYQLQWLNLKDQDTAVSVNSSSERNSSYGLTLSQAFH